MYNPVRFKSTDLDEAFALMDHNPFATIISVVENKPFISHLPLIPKRSGDQIEVIGHLAMANPHWKYLVHTPTTVIFNGAHTYITPQWYAKNNVPTWNYSAVHLSGQIELIENFDGLVACLKELSVHFEKLWPSGWKFFVPNDLAGGILPKSIVGFKIKVEEINFKKKLSQGSSSEDRIGVFRGLEARSDDNSHGVLTDMLKMYQPNGEFKKT